MAVKFVVALKSVFEMSSLQFRYTNKVLDMKDT